MTYSEKIITAFAMYRKTSDLVRETGLSRGTVLKYRKDKELIALANERRLDIISGAVFKMQSELTKCVDMLVMIRDDPEINPQIRVHACNALMNHCREWTLTADVIARVEALERTLIEADEDL